MYVETVAAFAPVTLPSQNLNNQQQKRIVGNLPQLLSVPSLRRTSLLYLRNSKTVYMSSDWKCNKLEFNFNFVSDMISRRKLFISSALLSGAALLLPNQSPAESIVASSTSNMPAKAKSILGDYNKAPRRLPSNLACEISDSQDTEVIQDTN
jgi:hypothetical protein